LLRKSGNACKGSCHLDWYTVVVLALLTDARQMELLSIRWHDVDVQRQVMTLRSQGMPGTFFALHQRTDTDSADQPGASTHLERMSYECPVGIQEPYRQLQAALRARPQGEESHTSPVALQNRL